MCGICGIATTGGQPSSELIRKMCSTIVHRGPDGEGIFVGPGVGLGMRRLAIIDLVTGDQPMANETGGVQVGFPAHSPQGNVVVIPAADVPVGPGVDLHDVPVAHQAGDLAGVPIGPQRADLP